MLPRTSYEFSLPAEKGLDFVAKTCRERQRRYSNGGIIVFDDDICSWKEVGYFRKTIYRIFLCAVVVLGMHCIFDVALIS